ncbi:MAG TPA: DUF1178 family protein [Micropepsaceae bacterium]|nr:DUF1178 family protein [Micropepsaceae bacterium]
MITYNLACAMGHEFEGWFANSAAYDAQEAQSALSCPVCGDAHVKKAIMAPAVRNSVTKAKGKTDVAPADAAAPDPQKLRQFMAGYRKFVEENADYVGPKFPEEARKIHYGEAEERHIYGESTLGEARELIEEGIAIAPVPPDPGDLN